MKLYDASNMVLQGNIINESTYFQRSDVDVAFNILSSI